jgi:hypothetical protein
LIAPAWVAWCPTEVPLPDRLGTVDHRRVVTFEPAGHLAEPPFGPVRHSGLDHALFGGGRLAAQ